MSVSEYDQRQYQLMAERLRGFECGAISLSILINDLDALVRCLEQADTEWKDLFRNEWLALEEVYSVALDRGQFRLTSEQKSVIEKAVRNLKGLLQQKIAEVPPTNKEI
jgi:hypothetical protein